MTSNAATLQTSSTKSYLTHYNMNHSKRGIAVIFSNESDTPSKSCNEENIDNEKLNETLSYLGFDVWLYHNFTLDDIVTTLKKGESYLICIFMYTHTHTRPICFLKNSYVF